LRAVVEPSEHVALSQVSDRSAAEMLQFVKDHGLEGVVAKRSDSVYQPGQRTGLRPGVVIALTSRCPQQIDCGDQKERRAIETGHFGGDTRLS
jgi:hypothetical protein